MVQLRIQRRLRHIKPGTARLIGRMDRLMCSCGHGRHQCHHFREQKFLLVLPFGRVIEDLVEPLRPQQVLQRRPHHYCRGTLFNKAIENRNGRHPCRLPKTTQYPLNKRLIANIEYLERGGTAHPTKKRRHAMRATWRWLLLVLLIGIYSLSIAYSADVSPAVRLPLIAPRPQPSKPPLRLIKTFGSPDVLPHVSFVAVTADGKFCFTNGARGGYTITANGWFTPNTGSRSFYINSFRTDSRSGLLSFCWVASTILLSSESSIAKSPDGGVLIAASRQQPAILSVGTPDGSTFRVMGDLARGSFSRTDRLHGCSTFAGRSARLFRIHGPGTIRMIGHVRPTAASTSSKENKTGTFQDWSTAFHDPKGSLDHVAGLYSTQTAKPSLPVAPRRINSSFAAAIRGPVSSTMPDSCEWLPKDPLPRGN